jgi:hypothetical protein
MRAVGVTMRATDRIPGVERYTDPLSGALLAIVVRDDFRGGRYNFLTPDDFPMQLGVNFYDPGQRIQPHVHVEAKRDVREQQELLFLKRGRAILHLYTPQRELAHDVELRAGDCVLLASGGHGLDILEDAQLIEAKQGPYLGVGEKIKFEPA